MKGQVKFGSTTTAKSGKTKSHSAKSTDENTTSAKTSTKSSDSTATSGTTGSDRTSTKPLSPTGKSTTATGGKVNINTATAEELDALPGIGPTKAQAIIDYRNQNGNFKNIEDIKNVKGIKEGEFSKIQDRITIR